MGARCCKIAGRWSPREAEAISLQEAISWVKKLGLQCCIFETNSQVIVGACNGQYGASYYHTIVANCLLNSKHFHNVLVLFAYQSTNRAAHLLANAAHFMSNYGEWMFTPPEFINHVLESDFLN